MEYVIGTAAPALAADAFVRGQKRFALSLGEYRGTWAVVVFAPRHADILELAQLEEAFGADGAVILAARTTTRSPTVTAAIPSASRSSRRWPRSAGSR
jgi:hypothetical protein